MVATERRLFSFVAAVRSFSWAKDITLSLFSFLASLSLDSRENCAACVIFFLLFSSPLLSCSNLTKVGTRACKKIRVEETDTTLFSSFPSSPSLANVARV